MLPFKLIWTQGPSAASGRPARQGARAAGAREEAELHCGLACWSVPGPVLAVVSLCGGAGASTLTYLIGAVAARASSVPVLACDTGGPTAGLALYAGVRAPRTLAEISELLAEDEGPHGGLYATDQHGLRVIASEPQFRVAGNPQGIRRVLSDACAAHGLTVIDCGTLAREAERAALSQASHVAWLTHASPGALTRAWRVLQKIAPLSAHELVVARLEAGARKAPIAELSELADERAAPLLLMPHVPDLSARPLAEVSQAAQLTLQALAGELRR